MEFFLRESMGSIYLLFIDGSSSLKELRLNLFNSLNSLNF
jgi:hypothetical protein